jgi:hypothetical protein
MTDQWQARHLDQATCCHPLPCPRRFDRFDAGYAGGRQEVHPGGRAGPHETHPRASLWCGPGKGPGRAWEGPGKGPGRAREAMGWVRDLGILDRDHQAKHTGTNRLRRLRRLRTWWFWPALDCSTNIRDKLETDETKKLGPVNELKFQAGPWHLWLGFCLVGFNLYQLGHTWSFGAHKSSNNACYAFDLSQKNSLMCRFLKSIFVFGETSLASQLWENLQETMAVTILNPLVLFFVFKPSKRSHL